MTRILGLLLLATLLCFTMLFPSCGGDDDNPVDPGDTTRPTVVSTSPENDAEFVLPASEISATFSESMDPASLTATSFLIDPAVSGTVSYSTNSITFSPATTLDSSTNYTATITIAAKDMAGNTLAAAYVWQFSTFRDTVPPTVIATVPTDGNQFFKVTRSLSATFSEDMDPATMNVGTFVLTPAVAGAVSYADRVITFTPTTPLDTATDYTATISSAAKDLIGNRLTAGYEWRFATHRDTIPPTSSVFTPTTDAVFGDSLAIEIVAQDTDGIGMVQFFADGIEIAGAIDSLPPYQYVWKPTGLVLGSEHEISAKVYDSVGNTAMSDTVTVHYLWQLLIADGDEALIHRDIDNVYVRSSETLLEFRVETSEGWIDYNDSITNLGFTMAFYFDTDQDRSTGDTATVVSDVTVPINDIGAEHMMIIGRYGDNLRSWMDTSWSPPGDVNGLRITSNSNYFEVAIEHYRLVNPTVFDLVLGNFTLFKTGPSDPGVFKFDWAPDSSHATYRVDRSFMGAPAVPTVDSKSSNNANSSTAVGDNRQNIPFN